MIEEHIPRLRPDHGPPLRIVATMDAVLGDPSGRDFTRRRLLQIAGTAGLAAATASACGIWDHPTPPSTQNPAPPANPAATPGASPAANPPLAPQAPPVAPAGQILGREAWGAQPARPGGIPQPGLTSMTVHHTAAFLGDNSNAPERLRQHQRYHQDTHGWIDIAYHLSVDRNGNIYQLRDPMLVGNTATSYDPTGHFLVVCEGDFEQEEVTEAQLDGAALAFAWAATQYGISPATLSGHRDESHDTACPGASLYSHVTSGDLQRRIEALGPVNLQLITGQEAIDAGAAIEAGQR